MRGDEVWAVVAHYGEPSVTLGCLESLQRAGVNSGHIVVVDNQGGLREALQRGSVPAAGGGEVTLLEPGENLGFAGAAHLGGRAALAGGAGWLWFVNNDARAEGSCLEQLLAVAGDPRVGLLSPVIEYDEGGVWFAGGEVDRRTLDVRHETEVRSPEPFETGFVTGCALLARAEMARACGLPDPTLFMYLEDVEWLLRAQNAGWKAVVVPRARVRHHVERRGRRRVFSDDAVYYVTRNRLLLAARNGSLPAAFLPTMGWAGRQLLKSAGACEAAARGAAASRALWDGLRGRSGRRPVSRACLRSTMGGTRG